MLMVLENLRLGVLSVLEIEEHISANIICRSHSNFELFCNGFHLVIRFIIQLPETTPSNLL